MAERKKTTAKRTDKPAEQIRLDYSGIKMIGSSWFSIKDKFKKGFHSADECAKHFNSEVK